VSAPERPDPIVVELAPGAGENGLATMLAGLVFQNVTDKPHKRRDFARLAGRVSIVAEDAGVALTMVFGRGKMVVHDGIVGIPDVTIRADSESIMDMSLVELTRRFALPDPRGEVSKRVNAATRAGRVKMYGALANLPLVLRLTRVMSIH